MKYTPPHPNENLSKEHQQAVLNAVDLEYPTTYLLWDGGFYTFYMYKLPEEFRYEDRE